MSKLVRLVQVAGISCPLITRGMNTDRKIRYYPITDGEMGLLREEDPMTFKLQWLNGLVEVKNPEEWNDIQKRIWGHVREREVAVPVPEVPTDRAVALAIQLAKEG